MMDYVMSTGPLSVCVDASDWARYVVRALFTCLLAQPRLLTGNLSLSTLSLLTVGAAATKAAS